MIKTPLCRLLGIEHPILQGGMAWVGTAELVAAVSEAGAFGILGGGNAPPDWVRAQIRETKARTRKPFGLNIAMFSPFVDQLVDICIEERLKAVATGAGNPGPIIPRLKEAGIIVMPVVASVALAKRLERAGADIIVAEGMESGGHIGDISTMPLVPEVVDAVKVPVVAAGGFADGRGLVAALALGAVGIQMGTRFVCTTECTAHSNYKAKIVAAGDRATMTTGHSLGHPVRAIKNPMAHDFEELEKRGATEAEVIEFGTGRLRAAVVDGDMVHGSVMAGQIAGLIDDVVSCRELVERIIRQAEDVMDGLTRYR